MNGIRIQNGNHVGICNSRCWKADPGTPCSCSACLGTNHAKGVAHAMAEAVKLLKAEKKANKKGWQPGVRVTGQLPLL